MLVFFYAPLDADQGFIQKIFYIHVPLAIVSLCGFMFGGADGDRVPAHRRPQVGHALLRGDPHGAHLRVAGLITGSIWAKASWGHWWVWNEPTLVSFLIVLLLFCTYQPLRFSIEDPERQARYAAVFAITCAALRAAQLHRRPARRPRSCTRACSPSTGGRLPGPMALDVPRLADRDRAALRDALEVRDGRQERALADRAGCAARCSARTSTGPTAARRRRCEPAARLRAGAAARHTPGKFVAAAYIVVFVILLVYVAIMAVRAQRIERDLAQLQRDVEAQRAQGDPPARAGCRERRGAGWPGLRRRRGALGIAAVSELLAIGVSHKTAPVEIRERLALPEARAERVPARPVRARRACTRRWRSPPATAPSSTLVVGDPVDGREHGAGDARPPRRDPPDRAHRRDLRPPQLRRGAAPVPGRLRP